jgi:phosphatidylserine/phosphatidylglycerophosphate/cardiolipin synthase-like enzyme
MSKVKVRAYVSPTLVLLAFDWPEGPKHSDFLGFAIKRSPGHKAGAKSDFLLNKLGFNDPVKDPGPHPSDKAPIQKFHWWDSGIDSEDRGNKFQYTVYPVCGTGPDDLTQVKEDAATIDVQIPHEEDGPIGTYFNRAVVSSQSFDSLKTKTHNNLAKEMDWLANGLQNAIPNFLKGARKVEGAIYHLTDNRWVVPALKKIPNIISMVYNYKANKDTTDMPAVNKLKSKTRIFKKRTKTNIMHNKVIVRYENDKPSAVLMGSTNFTPEAFTVQANLLHTFKSKLLAMYYSKRCELLKHDPTKAATAKGADWKVINDIRGSKIRLFFSPEPKGQRKSIDAVVDAVKHAKKSVLFCMFSPTDQALLKAIMNAGNQKKMMFGLLNSITDPTKSKKNKLAKDSDKAMANPTPSQQIQTEVFHRSQKQKDIVSFAFFGEKKAKAPAGFLPELQTIDTSKYSLYKPKKGKGAPTVHIHHKFIVIDGETDNPTIYTGSANMSKNSVENNDENLLEIKRNTKLAQIYVAEFFRLYEHYRARALWNRYHPAGSTASHGGAYNLRLKTTRDEWVKGAYKTGTLEYISRVNLTTKVKNKS